MTKYWILPLWLTIHSPLLCGLLLARCQYLHRSNIVWVGYPTIPIVAFRWQHCHFWLTRSSLIFQFPTALSSSLRSLRSLRSVRPGKAEERSEGERLRPSTRLNSSVAVVRTLNCLISRSPLHSHFCGCLSPSLGKIHRSANDSRKLRVVGIYSELVNRFLARQVSSRHLARIWRDFTMVNMANESVISTELFKSLFPSRSALDFSPLAPTPTPSFPLFFSFHATRIARADLHFACSVLRDLYLEFFVIRKA